MGAMTSVARRVGGAAMALLLSCGGETASPRAEPLASPSDGATPASADPSLAAEPGSGDLLLTWVGGDSRAWRLYFARSSDRGGHWSTPVAITNDSGEVHPHGETAPRLVAGPAGQLAVVWVRDVPVATRRWPASAVRVARSLDGGRSWLPPATLNDDTTAAPVGHNFQGAAWIGDSGLVAAWLDERRDTPAEHHHDAALTAGDSTSEADATVYLARSPDFGGSWEPNRPVWGGACPCCRITLARAPRGGGVAAWRHHFPGNVRDVVTAALTPVPRPPARVHEDGWVYPGCPHNGPGLAVGADGARHVVWYTGRTGGAGLYYARSTDTVTTAPVPLVTGSTLPPVHATVAASENGDAAVALDAAADGRRAIGVAWVRAGGARPRVVPLPHSEGGSYPQILWAGRGAMVVAWTAAGARSEVRLARVALPDAQQ
jgi:hypothetical protein